MKIKALILTLVAALFLSGSTSVASYAKEKVTIGENVSQEKSDVSTEDLTFDVWQSMNDELEEANKDENSGDISEIENHPVLSNIGVATTDSDSEIIYEIEPNDEEYLADSIYNEARAFGTLSLYDLDFYKFTITSKTEIAVAAVSQAELIFGVRNSYEQFISPVWSDNYYEDGIYGYGQIYSLDPGVYYIVMLDNLDYYNETYMVGYTIKSTVPEAGSTKEYAIPITMGQIYEKDWNVDNDEKEHYSKFALNEKGIVTIEATRPIDDDGSALGIYFYLVDENGDPIMDYDSYYTRNDWSKNKNQFSVGLEAGTYYLIMTTDFFVEYGIIGTDYKLTFTPTAYCESEPDYLSTEDENPTTIEFGKAYTGFIGSDCDPEYYLNYNYDRVDLYKFNIKEGQAYQIVFECSKDALIEKLRPENALSIYEEKTGEFNQWQTPIVWKQKTIGTKIQWQGVFTAKLTGTAVLQICPDMYTDPQTQYSIKVGNMTGCKDGNHVYDDNVDGTCNNCGVNRETIEVRNVVHMYRMYNPNTGEHFYTGSDVEKNNLIAVGWKYEGVGFTFPANTGAPVYRLFQSWTGEHLYTMDEHEKNSLMASGWNYEGIAFNSAYDTEAVQYRLHNPNTNCGAYHFTFSQEERQNLLNLGWEDQGIGWYSCWK